MENISRKDILAMVGHLNVTYGNQCLSLATVLRVSDALHAFAKTLPADDVPDAKADSLKESK